MACMVRMQHLAHAFPLLVLGESRRGVQHASHPVTNVSRCAGAVSDFSY
jgi:hypothetical protein